MVQRSNKFKVLSVKLNIMKKILTLLVCIIIVQLTEAQVQKGSLFLGGSIGISSSKTEDDNGDKMSGMSWNIAPQIGKAIQQNKVIGIEILAGGLSNKNTNSLGNVSKNSGSQYGIGIFYRQYFPIYKKWMFYGQTNAGLNFSNSTISNSGIKLSKINAMGVNINASLGITYQVTKKLWLEAGLSNLVGIGYNYQKSENLSPAGAITSSFKTNNISANFNLNGSNNFAFGFRWIIPAKG